MSIAPKSGTTWGMATVHSIRTKGQDTAFTDLYSLVPWADFVTYPGETQAERTAHWVNVSSRFLFGAFKSHFHPPIISLRDDVKYIIGVRDALDVLASFRTFLAMHTPEFSALWGGFPPLSQSDEDFENMMLKDAGDGKGGLLQQFVFTYLKSWWPYLNKTNVLLLHYKDRARDPSADIDRISRFLNISLSSEEKANVIEQTSFQYMKQHEQKYAVCLFDELRAKGKVPANFGCALHRHAMIAKGVARSGMHEVPADIQARVQQMCVATLGEEICLWLKTGGPLPSASPPS